MAVRRIQVTTQPAVGSNGSAVGIEDNGTNNTIEATEIS